MKHAITKAKTTYKISRFSVDHREAGIGIGIKDVKCSLILEMNPDGSPARLLVKHDAVNDLVRSLEGYTFPHIIMAEFPADI
jgi:hypothetical protein